MKKVCLNETGCHGILTVGREYQILRSVRDSYVVKRDDDSVDRMDKSRFGTKEEYNSLVERHEAFKIKLEKRWKE